MFTAFVDESIHNRGDFIVAALVFAPDDIGARIAATLTACGFDPATDEFKSSMKMEDNRSAHELRTKLRVLLLEYSVATVVCARSERETVGEYCLILLREIVERYPEMDRGTIYFDNGFCVNPDHLPTRWCAVTKCDSRAVRGIQLADCAAYLVALLLLSELGINKKTIRSVSYEGNPQIELGWSLWTTLRYSLASKEAAHGGQIDLDVDEFSPLMKPYGLLISENCNAQVREAAEKRLGAVWVGCVH